MADFATAGRTHAAGLADAIGREVVMEQEALLVGALQRIDILLVFARSESRHDKGLGLAAGEERRAMRARQHADFGDDRAHGLHVAAVDAHAGVENVPAHDLGLQRLEGFADLLLGEFRFAAFRKERRHDLRLHGVDGGVALLLDGVLVGFAQFSFGDLGDGVRDVCRVGDDEVAGVLGGALGKADDGVDHRLEAAMAQHDRFQHGLLGELLGFRLDHQHGVLRAGDDEIELGKLHLLDRRIEFELTVDAADARAADGSHERDAGKRQRR